MKPSLLLALAVAPALFAAPPDLAALRQAAVKSAEAHQVEVHFDQSYAANDNPKQRVDLYLPKHRATDRPLPVVCYIHGGGWISGDRIGAFAGAMPMLATGEYAVVGIGYRLATEAPWPAQIHDCKAAIRWIRAHAQEYQLDPEKIGVAGNSAGGHLAALLGTSGGVAELEGALGPHTRESSRVTCVVALCAPADLTLPLQFDHAHRPIVNDPAVVALLGGPSAAKHAEAVAASPITYVSPDDPPFLIAHGTKDPRVDYTHALALHAALQKAGVSALLIPLTDGGHGAPSNPAVAARARQFWDLHLRGIPQQISTAPIPSQPDSPPAAPK